MRLLLQSIETGRFLVNDGTGVPTWTRSLQVALESGLIHDEEQASQLIEDYFDVGAACVVDLDDFC